MSPLFGLMKLAEMGMDKAGIRDSLASREAAASGGQAMQMANSPMMSLVGGGPLSQPMAQMSPVIPQGATVTPDMFDKALALGERFGGPQAGGPVSPLQAVLQKTGVIDQPSIDQEQLMGLLSMIQGAASGKPGAPQLLTGPQTPNMGMLAQDFTAQNQASGGLRGKMAKLIMGMA
jgi:hypothetical protein